MSTTHFVSACILLLAAGCASAPPPAPVAPAPVVEPAVASGGAAAETPIEQPAPMDGDIQFTEAAPKAKTVAPDAPVGGLRMDSASGHDMKTAHIHAAH